MTQFSPTSLLTAMTQLTTTPASDRYVVIIITTDIVATVDTIVTTVVTTVDTMVTTVVTTADTVGTTDILATVDPTVTTDSVAIISSNEE